MKSLAPRIFRDADTLRPSDLRATFEHWRRDLDDLERHRWTHSCFVLDFKDLDQAGPDGTNEGVFKVQPPAALGAWEIVGLEARVAAASGDHVLTVADDGTTIDTLTVTATSATAFAAETKATSHQIAAGSEVTFTLTGYASVAVANAQVTVHIRSDRLGGSVPATLDIPTFQDGSTVDGSDLAAEIQDYKDDIDAHNTGNTALRIEVLQIRNDTGTNPVALQFAIPATGSTLHSFGAYLLQTSGGGHQTLFRVTDTDTATNYDVTVVGGGVNTFASDAETSVAATQANDDPDDTADHWTATIDPAGTSTDVKRAVLVLYWQD